MAEMADLGRNTSQDDIQKLIRAYFIQLTQGCGNEKCDNPNCVTGGGTKPLDPNPAAAQAVLLAKQHKNGVCTFLLHKDAKPSNAHKTSQHPSTSSPTPSISSSLPGDEPMETESNNNKDFNGSVTDNIGITEAEVMKLITAIKDDNAAATNKKLVEVLYNTFSCPESLNCSFLKENTSPRAGDNQITVDIVSVRRVYAALFELEKDSITTVLVNAINAYCSTIKPFISIPLNHIVILFENPLLHSPEFLDAAFPKFLALLASTNIDQKAILVDWYSNYSIKDITNFISILQQTLTITTLQIEDDVKDPLQSYSTIANGTHVMMIFYVANLVISKKDKKCRPHSTKLLSVVASPIPREVQEKQLNLFEMLLMKCDVHPSETYSTPIKLTDFTNECINDGLNMLVDYKRQSHRMVNGNKKPVGKTFSFLDYPYILEPANKVEKLFFDNQLSMINERHRTLFHAIITGIPDIPFLLLRVDRNNLVGDTLAQLEAIAELNPTDLRKQLRVEFKDEEGIDEGGVQKEFFQLLIEKLFDPMNGMFLYNDTNHFHWFNLDSLESEQQYHLIGILLGLAIYNNVILDVRFPLVIYNKLIGCNVTFQDLYTSHPQIAQSLQSMLDFERDNDSFEATFMSTFSVSYTDMYSCQQTVCLKEGGDQITVTTDNRQEFVTLYSDWLLNRSIERSFNEFKKGFDVVMGESNLADLFTAEEVELLVCGNKEWDFNTLEENTQYDGFTKSHSVVQNFWEIFYEFPEERKKQLLAFVTGSDRVPVGGLSKTKMVIVKNGPDSNRLPTAHTCFNALLLCNYSTKEKLKERLEKAIENGKGFGML